MNPIKEWYKRQLSDPQLVQLALMLLVAVLAIVFFGDMLAPAIAALVFSFLLDGPAERLRRVGVGNFVAVSLVFTAFIALVVVGFFTLLPPIMGQFAQFFTLMPTMFTSFQDTLMHLPEAYPGVVSEDQMVELMDNLRIELIAMGQQAVQFSIGSIVNLITLVVYAILVPVMVFFFLKDKTAILGWMGSFLPKDRGLMDQVFDEVMARTGDYARGKVYEILIVGFVSYAFYWSIDLQFAAFLALITGLSVLVPYIGAALVTFPIAFVAFFQWGASTEWVIAVGGYLVLQAFDGNLLAPLLFSEVVKLHPNAIIIAILVFGGLWGLWGVFFAIPLATLAQAVIRGWTERVHAAAETP